MLTREQIEEILSESHEKGLSIKKLLEEKGIPAHQNFRWKRKYVREQIAEGFPVTSIEVTQVKRSWFWEGDVNALEGIGRFVLGLPHEVSVEEGPKLKAWLTENGAFTQKKFK